MKSVLPVAFALVLAGCGDDPGARLERAREALAANDYRAAQIDLAAALQQSPRDPQLLRLQAGAQLALGDGLAAQATLDRLAAVVGRDASWALLAGEAALLRDQPKAALVAVGEGGGAEAHRIRGVARLMMEDEAAAATEFERGAGASGDKARLHADYARLLLRRGDLKRARAEADASLAADPRALDPLLVDGQVAVAAGDLARGLGSYDKALKRYPGNLAALTGKAGALGDLGRLDEMGKLIASADRGGEQPALVYLRARQAAAVNDWKKVRTLIQPHEARLARNDDAMLLYAQAHTALGQPELSRARLTPIVRRAPGNRLAVRALAEAQLAGGDARAAMVTLAPWADRREAAREELALMARAAKAAGDPAAASYVKRARFPSPEELASELGRGDAALKARNWSAAAAAYSRILAVTDGRNPLVLNNLAFAKSELGAKDEALALALRALKLAPDNPSVMDTAGWLLFETGAKARALPLLRAAAAKAPTNKTIAAHLAAASGQG